MTIREDLLSAALDEMGSFFSRDDAERVINRLKARLAEPSEEMIEAAAKVLEPQFFREMKMTGVARAIRQGARNRARAAWAAALRAV